MGPLISQPAEAQRTLLCIVLRTSRPWVVSGGVGRDHLQNLDRSFPPRPDKNGGVLLVFQLTSISKMKAGTHSFESFKTLDHLYISFVPEIKERAVENVRSFVERIHDDL